MYDIETKPDAFEKEKALEGKVFELYEKTDNREFKCHIQFIKAESLCEAEDKASEVDPDYWRKKSVRPVDLEYVWETLVQLHYSFKMAESVLGLEDLID